MNGKEQIIHTSRLVLREINEYDAESALDILTHKEVSKTFLLPDFKCREDALPVFESLKRTSHDPARFVYGIYLDGNMIGFLNEVEKNGTEIETSVYEGAKTVEACLAIIESSKTGKIVYPDYNFNSTVK